MEGQLDRLEDWSEGQSKAGQIGQKAGWKEVGLVGRLVGRPVRPVGRLIGRPVRPVGRLVSLV